MKHTILKKNVPFGPTRHKTEAKPKQRYHYTSEEREAKRRYHLKFGFTEEEGKLKGKVPTDNSLDYWELEEGNWYILIDEESVKRVYLKHIYSLVHYWFSDTEEVTATIPESIHNYRNTWCCLHDV